MDDQIEQNNTFRVKRYFPFKPPRYYCSACRSSFLQDTRICPRCKARFYACYLATFLIGTIISCNYLGIKAGIIAGIIEFAYLIGAITIGDDVDNTGYALGKKDAFLHIVSLVFACMIAFKYLHFLAYIG